MLGFYNYTVVLTYVGMLIGFAGMTFAMNGNLQSALICLMVAGMCDMFDGKIASTKERTAQEKRFGVQIDSLSDLICFGGLPAIIVCTVSNSSVLTFYIAGLYFLCALIRLAWFNVDEEERQKSSDGPREFYLGMPVTTIALLLPALLGLGRLYSWPLNPVGIGVLVFSGLAFLTPFRLKKPKLLGKICMLLCGCAELAILLMGVKL